MKGFDKKRWIAAGIAVIIAAAMPVTAFARTDGHAYRHGRHGTEPTIVLTDSVLQ